MESRAVCQRETCDIAAENRIMMMTSDASLSLTERSMSSPLGTLTANGSLAATKARRPMTVPDFVAAKRQNVRLTVLTAYDYTMARLLDDAGVDALLVGDSLR